LYNSIISFQQVFIIPYKASALNGSPLLKDSDGNQLTLLTPYKVTTIPPPSLAATSHCMPAACFGMEGEEDEEPNFRLEKIGASEIFGVGRTQLKGWIPAFLCYFLNIIDTLILTHT
jgi:hypothetical protein